MRRLSVLFVALFTLVAACSSPAPTPPEETPAAPAAAPAPTPTPVPAGAKRYDLVKGDSKASYVVTELLAGASVRNEAIGVTSDVTGELILGADGKIAASTFTVDLRTLKSDRSNRDNYIRGNGLESTKYPMATFTISEVKGSPSFATGSTDSFELIGTMKIRETEKSVTWAVTSSVADGKILWNAVLDTKLTDWGISPPVLLVRSVAEVDDPFKLKVDLLFQPAN